ncbi:MAG TPA: SurA N-terminal domain-containing protein [Verrucomicrobiae bacterium]|nr:SurA N-terminal domain-containing protein [Verrucomicrobiae bacterium]
MFANIRRHQKWLWYIIASAVIISFTWYLNPSNQGGRGGGGMFNSNVGTINGRPITRTQYGDVQKDALLKYFFTYGSWYGSDEFSRQNEGFLDREIRQRLFLLEKARELNVHVTPENVAEWFREQFGREHAFTEAEYNNLINNLKQKGVSEADLNRFARGEIAARHLMQVAGLPGRLVTPQEAEAQYRRDNQQVAVDAVFFTSSNFVSKVNLDMANLTRHYSNQLQNFREPDKLQISYVAFPASNYFASADKTFAGITNLNQMVEEMYRQRGTNFYTDPTGAPMAPDAAKAKIKEDERHRLALVEARKDATEFAEALLNATNAPAGKSRATILDELAQQKKLAVKVTEPFSQYEIPEGMDVPEKFGQVVAQLTPEAPFVEEPIVGGDAVYIIALKNKLASHVPPLAQIQDKVTEDYKRYESRRLANEAGQSFFAKLQAALAAGKAFNAAAMETGQSVTSLAPFSMVSRTIQGLDPRVNPSMIKNTAFALKEGETSQFVPSGDGGFVLHVNKFIPASDADVKANLPGFIANLQRSGQSQAFSEWFTKEFQQARLSLVTDKNDKGGPDTSATQ